MHYAACRELPRQRLPTVSVVQGVLGPALQLTDNQQSNSKFLLCCSEFVAGRGRTEGVVLGGFLMSEWAVGPGIPVG